MQAEGMLGNDKTLCFYLELLLTRSFALVVKWKRTRSRCLFDSHERTCYMRNLSILLYEKQRVTLLKINQIQNHVSETPKLYEEV